MKRKNLKSLAMHSNIVVIGTSDWQLKQAKLRLTVLRRMYGHFPTIHEP